MEIFSRGVVDTLNSYPFFFASTTVFICFALFYTGLTALRLIRASKDAAANPFAPSQVKDITGDFVAVAFFFVLIFGWHSQKRAVYYENYVELIGWAVFYTYTIFFVTTNLWKTWRRYGWETVRKYRLFDPPDPQS